VCNLYICIHILDYYVQIFYSNYNYGSRIFIIVLIKSVVWGWNLKSCRQNQTVQDESALTSRVRFGRRRDGLSTRVG
jgi:hypothetical protein